MTPDQQTRLKELAEDDRVLGIRFYATLDDARMANDAHRLAILQEQINATQS